MYLYRFEVILKSEVIPVVIAASTDEQAFQLVDIELEKYFLKQPEVDEISLYEKKRIRTGNGFVLYERETILNP
ncbi:DUF3906 family protein [Fictibacillus sp. 5RED26]|uniref:DUF3906 family protein n=1 Tax=Fictibacillus phosphorivorans TaxID=1221500 RepID=A0A160INJ6_9BACL|nr:MULTISPECIES: DUF3906 family protein [Fictibacillus]ANC77122.1 hypothetical protein ABE65_010035 [Fictibacillus phosphorivorans]MBH0156198.1 DUF3906 family protein [Fictibacillus sp. 5RED26]MBH0168014.1 DUF3906 family protein [Fictibacillus sp. 18YEL24]MBH0173357.1 DUF3906 family protein [Fictibacillus sp. 23RED33]